MDKSEGKDWFSKTLNSVTEEAAKVYKISRIKLEISSLNKSKTEKLKSMSRRLLELIYNGKIDSELFEPEYSSYLKDEEKIASLEEETADIKSNLRFGGKKKDNINIDKQDKEEKKEPEI